MYCLIPSQFKAVKYADFFCILTAKTADQYYTQLKKRYVLVAKTHSM